MNGITANVVLLDLDLIFLRSNISNLNISETVRAGVKLLRITFIEAFATEWHHMNVVLGDLDLFFQGQTFETLISLKR